MARAQPFRYYGYRFHARFWRDHHKKMPIDEQMLRRDGEQVGFNSILHSPAGLELWTAHLEDEPLLYARLEGDVTCAEVMLLPRRGEDVRARVITYSLGISRALGVSINPKPMVVRLDASESAVALDGVLFESAKVVRVEHRIVELPFG